MAERNNLPMSPELCERLQINSTYLSKFSQVIVDVANEYEQLMKLDREDRNIFWNVYIDALQSNTNLNSIQIICSTDDCNIDHRDMFKMLISAMENKSSITHLDIHMKCHSLDVLQQFSNLTHLSLNVKINIADLVKYCMSNPNLISLQLMSNEMNGTLSDIVPYCNKLQSLAFMVQNDFDELEYVPIAKLPKLCELRIEKNARNSITREGSLKSLINALALQKLLCLTVLSVKGFLINFDEIKEIAKIKTLTDLECEFCDLNNIDILAQLSQLDVLSINSEHQLLALCNAILKLFVAFNGNISICCGDNLINLNKRLRALTLTMQDNMETSDFEPLSNLANLPNLIIYGNNKIFSLFPLLHAFASKQSTVLQELTIETHSLSDDEVLQVSRLKTLRHLECGFADPQSIKFLQHLPNLESLIINSVHDPNDLKEGVLNVLMGCANEITVYRFGREIAFNKRLSKLTISNSSYTGEIFDGEEYALLSELPSFRTLHIKGDHKIGSFKKLFKALAAKNCSHFHELIVEAGSYPTKTTINDEETAKVAKILSLRRLRCGFSEGNCIDILAQLPKLQELNITTHPKGSLLQLLQVLSSRKTANLHCLNIEDGEISSAETALVARIHSLRTLQCGFVDGQHIELLAQLDLEDLTIRSYKDGSISCLLQTLSSKNPTSLKYLNIENIPISYEEAMAVVQMKALKVLHCQITNTQSIELLTELCELKELFIKLDQIDNKASKNLADLNKLIHLQIESTEVVSLTDLFKKFALKLNSTLQNLVVKNYDINLEELQDIVKIKSLRRLTCGVLEDEHLEHFKNLQELEFLAITSYHNMEDISQNLLKVLKECCKLQTIHFHYGSRFIDLEFLFEALKILKDVRNCKVQAPLLLRIPYFGGLTPEQIAIADEKYLKISK